MEIMAEGYYEEFLILLDSLKKELGQLAEISREKIKAVGEDDLMALDAALKREQALSLSLRGLEQHRTKLLRSMHMENVSLSALPSHYPESMQLRARRTVEALQQAYRLYCGCSHAARNALEMNIHQIDRALERMDPAHYEPPASGYPGRNENPSVQPPKSMKTDFLA
jgi:hypothetical protein